jgi:hypothetical protein
MNWNEFWRKRSGPSRYVIQVFVCRNWEWPRKAQFGQPVPRPRFDEHLPKVGCCQDRQIGKEEMGRMCSAHRNHYCLLKEYNLQSFSLLSWRGRHHVTLKHWKQSTRLHGITYQRHYSWAMPGYAWNKESAKWLIDQRSRILYPCVPRVLPIWYLSTHYHWHQSISVLWSHIHSSAFPITRHFLPRFRSGDRGCFCSEENAVHFPGMTCERNLNIFMTSWGNQLSWHEFRIRSSIVNLRQGVYVCRKSTTLPSDGFHVRTRNP